MMAFYQLFVHAPLSIMLPIFFLGACLGSFLNVCFWRIPRGVSVVHPPSSCQSCGFKIPLWRNIPLLSWALQAGRCSSCSSSIPARYVLFELISGAIIAGLAAAIAIVSSDGFIDLGMGFNTYLLSISLPWLLVGFIYYLSNRLYLGRDSQFIVPQESIGDGLNDGALDDESDGTAQ